MRVRRVGCASPAGTPGWAPGGVTTARPSPGGEEGCCARWPGAGWWSLRGEPASLWVAPRGGGLLQRAPREYGPHPYPSGCAHWGFIPSCCTGRFPTTKDISKCPSFWSRSGSTSKISGRILQFVAGPFSSAESTNEADWATLSHRPPRFVKTVAFSAKPSWCPTLHWSI